jgi:hypothetical protein
MENYIAKPVKVTAEKFLKGLTTPPGVRYNPKASPEAYFKLGTNAETIIESGDYIVTDEFGNVFKMPEKQFLETYQKV